MTRPPLATALAFLALAALPAPALAGVVIKAKSHGESGASVMELEGKRMRTESTGSSERITLFDGQAQRLLLVNPEKKSYRVMDEASAKRTADQMAARLAQLPPEVRARLQAQPGAGATPARHRWTIEKTGASATVAGRACTFYRVLKDGKAEGTGGHRQEFCLIAWGGDLRRDDFAALAAMGLFAEKLASTMASGLGGGRGPGDLDGRLFGGWFADAPGFPGQAVRIDASGARTVDWELVSVERRSIPADRFAPPAGFEEQSLDAEGGAPRRRSR